jgi:hypothetical protein
LRSPTVAIATCAEVAGAVEDDLLVIEALRGRGIDTIHAVWNDPSVDWSAFALVVIRSTWDYVEQHDQFLAWATRLPRVLNSASILRWNTDKRYMRELAQAGVPVIPTRFVESDDEFELPSAPFVVKPTVSCAAKNTARYGIEDGPNAKEHVRRLQAAGRTAMISPTSRASRRRAKST